MHRLSRPTIFTLAFFSVLTTSRLLVSAPPTAVPKGPDWGSDAMVNDPHPAPGTPKGNRSGVPIPATSGATPVTLTPSAIVYDDHFPAAISEHSLLAVVDNNLWNLKNMTPVARGLNFSRVAEGLRSVMSADGKFLAVASNHGRRSAATVDVTVYDTATGAKVSEVLSALREDDVDYFGLAKSPFMLIASRGSPIGEASMELWNFQTGKIIRRFNCNYWEPSGVALSPDGKLVAISNTEVTRIYNVETSEVVATMDIPAGDVHMGVHIDANRESMHVRPVAMSNLSIASLAFSPDGTELAALASVFGRDGSRLICWDAKGKIKDDFVFDSSRPLTPAEHGMLQWSPDGAAFMVKGRWLIDRKFQRLVYGAQAGWADRLRGAFIDPAHYFVMREDNEKRAEIRDLPLEAIRKSIAAATDPKVPAILRPGQSVSLNLTLEKTRGDVETTREMILDAVTARLKRDGIKVADHQDTVLRLAYAEAAGAKPDETVGTLDYKIVAHDQDGKEKICFSDHVDQRASHEPGNTEAQDRTNFLIYMALQIPEMKLPYFIPAQDGLEMLPIETIPKTPR